jgi:hypothetical protein
MADAVTLRGATSTDDELLATLRRVRGQHGRLVDEPVEPIPKAWRTWVVDENGRVRRTRLELGLWFVAREALRAGRLFRPVGRRYADPAGFLMPDARWQADRHELAVTWAPARSQAPTGNAPAPAAAQRPPIRWPASSGSAAAR